VLGDIAESSPSAFPAAAEIQCFSFAKLIKGMGRGL
jgi:hypothetical protein